MTKSNFFSVLLILSAIMFLPFTTKAQVTIGSTYDPQPFSVLELFSNNERGFRLPQLTERQRDALVLPAIDPATGVSPAMGLQIFNTCTRCVDTWNGREWISLCDGDEPPIIINCGGRRMVVPRFAHFNLGGKRFNTAREQMEYAASLTGTSSETCHGSLFGGRFQWGRADIRHAISTDGKFTLWHGDGVNAIRHIHVTGFDPVTGQPQGAADSLFITDLVGWFNASEPPHGNLWGNGVVINTPTETGVPGDPILNPGQFFQSTSWAIRDNDPCRNVLGDGWRLPTQEEWELITPIYDCNPAAAIGSPVPANGVLNPNPASLFTWVRASCINNECNPVTDIVANPWRSDTRNGYVVYRTDELGGFEFEEGVNLLGANTPEPFLFLPAAGPRTTFGSVTSVGMSGNYWSSTFHDDTRSRLLSFSSSVVTPGAHSPNRAHGMSVRCVSE